MHDGMAWTHDRIVYTHDTIEFIHVQKGKTMFMVNVFSSSTILTITLIMTKYDKEHVPIKKHAE